MDKHAVSFQTQEKYYARGKLYFILDYLFIFYIFFRTGIIEHAFIDVTPKTGLRFNRELSYGHVIPMFSFLPLIILCRIMVQNASSTSVLKEKLSDWKTTHVWSFLTTTLLIAIAYLFSFFFADSIEALIYRFPEEYHYSILPAYYLSYIYTLLYSILRIFLSFDYYQSFYFAVNRVTLFLIAMAYYFLLNILFIFFPDHWFYLFF